MNEIIFALKHIFEAMGVLVITSGALYGIYCFMCRWFKQQKQPIDAITLHLGKSIILGLDFILAGDVIGTTTNPDYYELGILGIIVAIRTILSYFLGKEITELSQDHTH